VKRHRSNAGSTRQANRPSTPRPGSRRSTARDEPGSSPGTWCTRSSC